MKSLKKIAACGLLVMAVQANAQKLADVTVIAKTPAGRAWLAENVGVSMATGSAAEIKAAMDKLAGMGTEAAAITAAINSFGDAYNKQTAGLNSSALRLKYAENIAQNAFRDAKGGVKKVVAATAGTTASLEVAGAGNIAQGKAIVLKQTNGCSFAEQAEKLAVGTGENSSILTGSLEFLGTSVSAGKCNVDIHRDAAGVMGYNVKARKNFIQMVNAAVSEFRRMSKKDYSSAVAIEVWKKALAQAKADDEGVTTAPTAESQGPAVAAFVGHCEILHPNQVPAGM